MDPNDFKPELTKIQERYLKKIQKRIECCSYDQPYDEGEVVWIWGDKVELIDLLYDLNVPEKHWDNIIPHLGCPRCGFSDFEESSVIGVQTEYDRKLEKYFQDVKRKSGKVVKEFEEYLEKNPLLGYKHRFGKRIFKEIKDGKFPEIDIEGNFYRARKVTSEDIIASDEMFGPPTGKPTEGRFNHSGQSHLYLASSKDTALLEVAVTERPLLAWCQKFRISKKVDKILDLSFDWSEFSLSTSSLLLSLKLFDAIDKYKRNKENWKPDYFLTRYIMDCAKSLGYKGLKYNSSKDFGDHNIVLFYQEKLSIKPVGKPFVETFSISEKEKMLSELPDF